MPAPARYFVESPGNTILADHYNSELNNILAGFTPINFTAVSTNVTNWRADTDPGEAGSESLPTNTTGEIQRLKKVLREITGKTYGFESPARNLNQFFPVGSIIPFYDFNAAVSYDSNVWIPCNGAVISDADSVLNGLTLPNLSGRYIVGFGTDGGADLGSATFNTTIVGSNLKDLSHTHTAAHTHSATTHNHGPGSLRFQTMGVGNFGAPFFVPYRTAFDSGGSEAVILSLAVLSNTAGAVTCGTVSNFAVPSYTANGAAATANATPGASGAASVTTVTSGLSATQDVRPSSIRVRYLLRYK